MVWLRHSFSPPSPSSRADAGERNRQRSEGADKLPMPVAVAITLGRAAALIARTAAQRRLRFLRHHSLDEGADAKADRILQGIEPILTGKWTGRRRCRKMFSWRKLLSAAAHRLSECFTIRSLRQFSNFPPTLRHHLRQPGNRLVPCIPAKIAASSALSSRPSRSGISIYRLVRDPGAMSLGPRSPGATSVGALYHRAECLTHVGDSQAVRSLTQCGEPMRFAMAAPIDLRNDFDSVSLRRLAKRTRGRDPEPSSAGVGRGLRWWQQGRMRRGSGGVGLQIIRDWVLRFNAPRTGRAGRWEVTGRTLEAQRRSPPRTGGGC